MVPRTAPDVSVARLTPAPVAQPSYVKNWKNKGWNYAAATLEWFANDNHFDMNTYAYHTKVSENSAWKAPFSRKIKQEVEKLPNGNIEFGEKAMKEWSAGTSFDWDHHRYFIDRFAYRFGNAAAQYVLEDDELFFALAGTHFNYYGKGCKQDQFYSVRVTILLWDPFSFPSRVGAFMERGYNASRFLQLKCGYGSGPDGLPISQYAVWHQKFSNIGGN